MEIKTKISKWNLIKLNSFCTAKETVNKIKRQPSEWEKIIATKATDRRFISKIYNEHMQLTIRKTTQSKYGAKDLNRHSCKEDTQMANKQKERCSTSFIIVVIVVQSPSCIQFFATPWSVACQASLAITLSLSLLKLMSIELVMPSNYLILCCLLLLLLSILPSIKVFSNESAVRIKWPKYWGFSISPSNKYLEFISFRIDWFDLLAVQLNLKSLLQHHSWKTSVLWCSAFFMVQLSYP